MKAAMKNNYSLRTAFFMVSSLFFLWAFLHNINPILIPHLKKACNLSDTKSALIDSSVYLGYFIMALPAGWFMHRYGYKNGILLGLLLYCLGAFLFIPAASARSYVFFLLALFVMASGATFLETIANPYVAQLGDPQNAARRLNFAQSFNGVGAFIAPLIGGKFILSGIEHSSSDFQQMTIKQIEAYLQAEAYTVKTPYLIIGSIVFIMIICFALAKLPEVVEHYEIKPISKFSFAVFRFRHFRHAVLTQFFYVGAQVGVGSFFIRFSKYI